MVGMLLGLAATVPYAPVRQWQRVEPAHPDFEEGADTARYVADAREAEEGTDPAEVEALRRMATGKWASLEPAWPPRFRWLSDRQNARSGAWQYVDHIAWPILLAEQALILLIAGGLLTFLIRRDRRRRAAA